MGLKSFTPKIQNPNRSKPNPNEYPEPPPQSHVKRRKTQTYLIYYESKDEFTYRRAGVYIKRRKTQT